MTEIRSIHGISGDEMTQRGLRYTPNARIAYLPYLSMTRGEMRLALLKQQADVYAAAYPEMPEYRKAATLIDNVLHKGVSRGVSFVGALDGKYLQAVAAEISRAVRAQAPASRAGFMLRNDIGTGIGDLIPVDDRLKACILAAKGNQFKISKCQTNAAIERILNGGVEKSGHHMLYKNLKTSDPLPAEVRTKRIFQQAGVEGLALSGEIQKSLMYDWVETAILKKNATGGVGPIGSRETSFVFGRKEGIGVDPVTLIVAISGLIAAALGGAAALQKELRSQKAYAMSEAKGFGTASVSPDQADWLGGGTQSGNSDLLLIGGAAVAAYLLLK